MVANIMLTKDLSFEVIQSVVIQAREFESNIHLIKDNHQANVKSILGLASLVCSALESKEEVQLDVSGKDEKEAFQAILQLLN